jgi:hypothetical protein
MKIYAYIAALVIVLGALWGVYHMGGADCRASAATAARESLERQNQLVMELDAANQKREVIFRDKIRIVEKSTDSCLNSILPDDVRLQLSGGNQAKPASNP